MYWPGKNWLANEQIMERRAEKVRARQSAFQTEMETQLLGSQITAVQVDEDWRLVITFQRQDGTMKTMTMEAV